MPNTLLNCLNDMAISLKELNSIVRKKASTAKPARKKKVSPEPELPPITAHHEETVPFGLRGVMASTEKLLAVNRGLSDLDDRDSYEFKRMHSVNDHLRDRIALDAGKLRRSAMITASKLRSLKGTFPGMFDPYSTGLIIGDRDEANPLSSPLEEINPMHILEQAHRITQMGPGGIGSEDAITPEANAVHSSQFGFVDAISGPESSRVGIDARLAHGVRIGSDRRLYQQFLNRRTGKMEWVTPDEISRKVLLLPE